MHKVTIFICMVACRHWRPGPSAAPSLLGCCAPDRIYEPFTSSPKQSSPARFEPDPGLAAGSDALAGLRGVHCDPALAGAPFVRGSERREIARSVTVTPRDCHSCSAAMLIWPRPMDNNRRV